MAGRKGEKHWRDALMLAVNRIREGDDDQRPFLARIAEKCVDLALDGDMQALKEIGDRLDGRAHQSVDIEHDITDPLGSLLKEIMNGGSRLGQSGEGPREP